MVDIRKILVPTDFSDHSLAALRHARDLAKAFDAKLILTHVLSDPLYPFALSTSNLPDLEKQLQAGCAHRLGELAEADAETGIAAEPIMKHGKAFVEIVETAKEEQADLIVMSTHGHHALEHAIVGSTTEKVVRSAACPVLVIPPSAG